MNAEKKHTINLMLFKIIGFYQMVDPKSPKIFGFNAYNFINIMLILFTSTITLIGLSGTLYTADSSLDNGLKNMQMIFYVACITVGNLKISIIIYNSNAIWKLFDITHDSFMTSKHCQKNNCKLVSCGERYAKIFPWYLFLFLMTALSWTTMPIILYYTESEKQTQNIENVRKNSVVNLKYPITIATYNKFHKAFYAVESLSTWYSAYGLATFDLFLYALLQLISTQYEIISSAYESLDFTAEQKGDGEMNNENMKKEFVSITTECQKIYEQLKIIYRISRPIVLICIIKDSLGMITMPYLIVMCYMQYGSIFNVDILTFSWTLFVAGILTFISCSLFQLVNERKESVNFGIYSCDWTRVDIRIKKLILLIMQINDSNSIKMNVTPSKCIDLPMFAAVVRSSYSITSVMINSNIHKLDKS